MSEVLEINGEQFLPAKIAATQVGYTGDYVTRLAREEKIFASKVGRQWFVSVRSLDEFVSTAEAEKEKWREALRSERKEGLRKPHEVFRKKTKPDEVPKEQVIATKELPIHEGAPRALVQTLAILLFGFFVGTSGYVTMHHGLESVSRYTASVDQMGLAVYHFFSATDTAGTTRSLDSRPTESADMQPTVPSGDDDRSGSFWKPNITGPSWDDTTSQVAGLSASGTTEIYRGRGSAGVHEYVSQYVVQVEELFEQVFSDDIFIEDSDRDGVVRISIPTHEGNERSTEFLLIPIEPNESVADGVQKLIDRSNEQLTLLERN